MSYAMMISPMVKKTEMPVEPPKDPTPSSKLGVMKLTHGAVQPLLHNRVSVLPMPVGRESNGIKNAHGAAWHAAHKAIQPI